MTLFLSTYVNRIDRKGRVSVPAAFRSALAGDSFQGIVLFPSPQFQALEGLSMERMKVMSDSIDTLDLFSEAQDDFASTLFSQAHSLNFDADGRVILPQDFCDYARLKDAVAFVGRGATFQIWNPDAFAGHQEIVRQRVHEKRATMKLKTTESRG